MSHILILGGDGYLGWPTAMHLSSRGHEVTVVDNYYKRAICKDLHINPLYEVPDLSVRAKRWHEITGKEIKVCVSDLTNINSMNALFNGKCNYDWCVEKKYTGIPDTIVHYAEQPSAPYSLMNNTTANNTISNNLLVTNNLLYSVKEYSRDSHIIKLGTMGEYGTPNIDIEEGWIDIEHNGRNGKFLFPRQGSSIYHTTKVMDTDLIWFAVRTWELKVTDLMQGPVYGIETEESIIDKDLSIIFFYDEIFGTILNRFITQAIIDYPLTVYGKGGQTRGYLNIKDTMQCIEKAVINPAKDSELRIFNQITETFSVNQLADKVYNVGQQLGFNVMIESIENPRKEAEEHYYNPAYQGLKKIGVMPHLLTEQVMDRFFQVVEAHKEAIRQETIFKGIKWD